MPTQTQSKPEKPHVRLPDSRRVNGMGFAARCLHYRVPATLTLLQVQFLCYMATLPQEPTVYTEIGKALQHDEGFSRRQVALLRKLGYINANKVRKGYTAVWHIQLTEKGVRFVWDLVA